MSVQRIRAENCRSLETVSTPLTSSTTTASRGGRREFLGEVPDFSGGIYFKFTNCFKLDRDACKSIAADAELKFQICTRISPELLRKEYPLANVCYPGSEIPDWFSHKSTGSSITIKLPPPPPAGWCNSGGFLGFALCAVADFKDYVNNYWDFRLHYNRYSKDKNGVVLNRGYGYLLGCWTFEDDAMIVNSNHVLLGYGLSLEGREEYCEGSVDETSFEFHPVAFAVKMCGIHLLYDEGRLSFSEEEEDDKPEPKRFKSI